jgi:hypothetical protein
MSKAFVGTLKAKCAEGELFWINPDNVELDKLSEGMAKRFNLFKGDACLEAFTEWEDTAGYVAEKRQILQLEVILKIYLTKLCFFDVARIHDSGF